MYAPGLLVLIVSCYAKDVPVEEKEREELTELDGDGGNGLMGKVEGLVEEYSQASDVLSTLDGSEETYRSMSERIRGIAPF